MIEWVKEHCPVCGQEYQYPIKGYKPKTCNRFDCSQKYLHHPEKYRKDENGRTPY